jgi:signal transduction histidine kinase
MKFSIRIRLTLLIGLVFLSVLVFLLSAGGLALYLRLNEELDRALKIERKFVIEMVEADFSGLLITNKETDEDLEKNFVEDLDEIVGFKREFVIVTFESKKFKPIYTNTRQRNILQQFPERFLSQSEGFYNQLLDNRRYRILISKQEWGTLVVGLENRIFYKVIDELGKILVVGIPLTLLLVLIGGWFLARLVMRPVVSAARMAENITLTQLEKRLPEYTGRDEFGILVTTLNHMIARLEEGVKQIRQFTQDAAHELRTPLTIQRGELELLYEEEKLPEKARSAVQKSLDRAISMGKIVDNLMLLAKSDAGMYPIQRHKFRLDEVLRETVEDAQNLLQVENIEIYQKECTHLEYFGDEQLIRRLLLNLSDNALKNTSEGQIKFDLKILSDSVEIIISDTGIGIPQEDLPHIFDRFYRGDKSRNTTNSGSGLGLSISRWIVNTHNGSINIESKSGKGTKVIITLPLSNSTH